MAIDQNTIRPMHPPTAMPWVKGAVSTQIGGRGENQDAVAYAETPRGLLVLVCDGMGGGPGGATASSIAVSEIIAGVQDALPEETRINLLIKAIRRANNAILQRAMADPTLTGMGSTCTALLISEESAIAAHVGDSRIYQLRGKRKHWRTFDHSLVFGLVAQGIISEEQARLSTQSNVITRALGIKPDVEVEAVELPYLAGDRFVLTTDGIHGSMPERDLLRLLVDRRPAPDEKVRLIAADVEARGVNAGGHHDNHTIAIVDLSQNSKLKQPMSTLAKQLLGGLALLLIVSVAINITLVRRGDAPPAAAAPDQSVTIDSLQTLIRQHTDSIATLQADNARLKSAPSTTGAADTELKALRDLIAKKDSTVDAFLNNVRPDGWTTKDNAKKLLDTYPRQ